MFKKKHKSDFRGIKLIMPVNSSRILKHTNTFSLFKQRYPEQIVQDHTGLL